jgi:hypothetical protein
MNEAGTGIVGDVIASDQRHGELIAAAEAPRAGGADQPSRSLAATSRRRLNSKLGLGKALLGQRIGEDQLLARLEGRNRFQPP